MSGTRGDGGGRVVAKQGFEMLLELEGRVELG